MDQLLPGDPLQSSRQSRVIAQALRLSLWPLLNRAPGPPGSLQAFRATVDAAARLLPVSPGVRIEPLADPRVETGEPPVAGEWVAPAGPVAEGAVLYLHGGGYVMCSPRTHRSITSRLAVESGLPVLVPRYRLAPEHPFPAALNDALAAYRWLLSRGVPAGRIIVAGDSAGGHLAASLTGEICRIGLPAPAGVVLLSPWVDLECELSLGSDARDAYISAHAAQRVARLVIGDADPRDPRLALLHRAWTDMPPFLIQVGGNEVLRPEAERLAKALGDACELQVWPGQMHVFQILDRLLPEARTALREAARFIGSVLHPSAAGAADAA
ncbi:alpha/beta hydrolase [Actinomadura craniellae]|uniref:Alpha/beta hydrolase n=1 Tax=Actinomadura craniellae TaxID=2231787 RepID=A0A365HAL8_9ACTN|nr:alpha/beta hydrolase [Actinomadura craniellae]RAY15313.1 alpha/beta hydrolase [Actinomadura craniellae]